MTEKTARDFLREAQAKIPRDRFPESPEGSEDYQLAILTEMERLQEADGWEKVSPGRWVKP